MNKINDWRKPNGVIFSYLSAGNCFFFEDELCMKIEFDSGDYNTIDLADGSMYIIGKDEVVNPVVIEINVTKNGRE